MIPTSNIQFFLSCLIFIFFILILFLKKREENTYMYLLLLQPNDATEVQELKVDTIPNYREGLKRRDKT